ncbi:MAG: hypothetical protein M9952_11165 [Microthrixaceae bacterium]|nr:hypothetical protein [Microthrixaceae bacterium]
MNALPEERLGQLRVAKLKALLGERLDGDEVVNSSPFGVGAALATRSGLVAFLIEEADRRSLGGALVWALRQRASLPGPIRVVVIVDADEPTAGHLAREATWFDVPVAVERIVGTASVPVAAAPFEDRGEAVEIPGEIHALVVGEVDDAASSGHRDVDVVVEWGVLRVEVLGLEVARVVPGDSAGGVRLEIGIGKFDREIAAMMHAEVPPATALHNAVEIVRTYRHAAAALHPLRDLVAERWLRQIALADPSLVGARELFPIDSTLQPQSLRESQPASASGVAADGSPIIAVFGAGVDLDIVPHAADTRALHDPDATLIIVMPQRNILAPVVAVADALVSPARFVNLELPY